MGLDEEIQFYLSTSQSTSLLTFHKNLISLSEVVTLQASAKGSAEVPRYKWHHNRAGEAVSEELPCTPGLLHPPSWTKAPTVQEVIKNESISL